MNNPIKSGFTTSEFWLSLLTVLLSAVISSGIIDPTSNTAKVFGVIAAVLATYGYTYTRGAVKTAALATQPAPDAPTN